MQKGQMVIEQLIVFIGEIIILLVMMYWTLNVGTEMLNYFLTIDTRIIMEGVAGFYDASEISNSTFSATMIIPPSPNILEIGKKTGYYVWVYPKEQFELQPTGKFSPSVTESKVKIKKVKEYPIVHFQGFNTIKEFSGTEALSFDEKKNTEVHVKRDKDGLIVIEVIK